MPTFLVSAIKNDNISKMPQNRNDFKTAPRLRTHSITDRKNSTKIQPSKKICKTWEIKPQINTQNDKGLTCQSLIVFYKDFILLHT